MLRRFHEIFEKIGWVAAWLESTIQVATRKGLRIQPDWLFGIWELATKCLCSFGSLTKALSQFVTKGKKKDNAVDLKDDQQKR